MPECITTRSEAETRALGRRIVGQLVPGDVLLLRGGLGAGKTAFTQGLAEGLDAPDIVSSPTYALHHVYPTTPVLHHFDLYRLQTLAEALEADLPDALGEGICVVEWPDVAADLYPQAAIEVEIDAQGDSRHFRITGLEGRGEA